MIIVILTALCIGGATILGSVSGFFFRNISQKFSDLVMAFSAGIMLAAAIFGLILPAAALTGKGIILQIESGILAGSLLLYLAERMIPHVQSALGLNALTSHKLDKVLLFVAAIAIHNFPEGLASGVSFGTGNVRDALLISAGIALQNLPEGMVTVIPLLAAGIRPGKAICCGILTGVIEIIGTIVGYLAVTATAAALPFLLSFAGGTMVYVICDEMIPETHGNSHEQASSFSFMIGFCIMMASDLIFG